MQYKVPQNIEIEDKIVGPLTLRQFVILLIAGGAILVLNYILIGPLRMLFFLAAFLIGGIAISIGFFKYGNQNFEVFLLAAIKTFFSPRERIWKRVPQPLPKEAPKIEKPEAKTPEEKRVEISKARQGLAELAKVIDSGGYAAVAKDHSGNFGPSVKPADEAPDLLQKTEEPKTEIDKIIEEASKAAPEREKLVSEFASVAPNRKMAETPKIKLRKDQYLQ